ncbi:hypothetical protein Hsero_1579 [Herbaspirillum seropedicae SmR1]|uniref:Uncharacterized protein n=2 Tax=Herbaspirillum seropedicae TaxID=964 RepID=D8IQ46_HERSS|nr:hypothetical protein Hsero_1579 [Herbaspirillum seropedicae SmR1]
MRATDIDLLIASFTGGPGLTSMLLIPSLPLSGALMNDHHIYQELGHFATEPLLPAEGWTIGAAFLLGLSVLGLLFLLQHWLGLGG